MSSNKGRGARNVQKNISKKMTVFWVVAPCSLVEVYRRFTGICCLQHQSSKFIQTCNIIHYGPKRRFAKIAKRKNFLNGPPSFPSSQISKIFLPGHYRDQYGNLNFSQTQEEKKHLC
jgi:hypothetical protein